MSYTGPIIPAKNANIVINIKIKMMITAQLLIMTLFRIPKINVNKANKPKIPQNQFQSYPIKKGITKASMKNKI